MATCNGSGYQSPPPIGRTIDRIFEDAQYTGEILLNGRKLRDYPKLCSKYDLSDTVLVDISRNRLSEVPLEVCQYLYVEKIHCYHNVIRSIPDAISQLQNLIHLILSRNQLTVLPPAVCQLTCLEVLHASNNKLVSLPEEIGQLKNLMDLDVSCNEISHLPVQIGDLPALRSLNLRNNFLVELPVEISRLQLFKLDFSSNRIEKIPPVFRKMESLEQLVLDHNPLTSPPAYICTKGRQHIMKYLHMEAVREDRKRGIMMGSDSDMKRYIRKSLPVHQSTDDFKTMLDAPESKWKRHTVLSNDSGYSTADGSEKNGWQSGEIYSHEENNHLTDVVRNYVRERETPHHMQSLHNDKQSLYYHYSHGTPHTSASIGSLNLNSSARSRSGSGLFQQQSVPPAKQEPGHYDTPRPGQAWPTTQGTSQQLLYHQPHLHPGSPYPSHRGHHQPPPVSSSYSTSSVHSSLSYVTSVASTLSSLSTTVSVTNTYNPLSSVTSAGSPANSTNHLTPLRTTHTPLSNRSFDSVASKSGPGAESNLSVASIRSSTPQVSIQNNVLNGSDQSAALSRQRSNSSLSSLTDHQPKQATGLIDHQPKQATSLLGYTARQLPSPQVSAKLRSESPSTWNSQAKFAGDHSGRNSVNSLPFSSYSSASAMSQRERWLGDRNSHSARQWQEQAVSEDQLSPPSADSLTPSSDIEDEFTRELKRQKADYEKKKKQAEMIRVQQEQEEEEEEKDERRRAARKLQEEQRMLMERQGQQVRQRELSSQEETRKQGEPKAQDSKQLVNGVGHLGPAQDYKKPPEGGTDHNNDNFQLDEEPNRRAELKLIEKNNVINKNTVTSHSFKEQRRLANGIQYRRAASDTYKKTGIASIVPPQTDGLQSIGNTGVPDSCQRSSTSTTPSMSPSPSPRNSVCHVPKPHLSGGSTSHIAKPISPSGSTSQLVKLSATKSSVPRAVPGPSTPAQNQAVRKAKLAGDSRSTTSSPVTARSARTTSAGQTQAPGASLQPALSQLRRSSNSSTTDDETRSKKIQTSATDISRLKPRLDEQNRRTPLQTSVAKMQKAGAGDVDGNKKLSTRSSANIYGLGRGKPGGGKTLEECSSNLSTRKREEKEDVEQMDRLRQMVESRLRVTLPDNLAEALRDGVVLCHLANQIRPRSVGSIHVPSPAVPKLTLAKCRRNVDNFLDACRKIGVDQEQLCGPQDILDEKGLSRVAITVAALVAIGTNPRTSAV